MTPTEPSYREIPLTQGHIAIVDASDYERVMQRKWIILKVKSREDGATIRYYARTLIGGGKQVLLHRFILGLDANSPIRLDHADRDGLHCWRANLRIASKSQNGANRARGRRIRRARYKGVIWDPSPRGKKPYRAQITAHGVHYSLGRFYTEEEAARRYDRAAVELFGEFAFLNFPT